MPKPNKAGTGLTQSHQPLTRRSGAADNQNVYQYS